MEKLAAILLFGGLVTGLWAYICTLINDYFEWHDGGDK